MGFMLQFSISMVLYYGSCSFYFLAVIRFAVSQEQFAKWYKPWIHGISIGFPLITASVGVVLGVYAEHNIAPLCWVSNYPKGWESNPQVDCKLPLVGGSLVVDPWCFV
jgi:hypothetical protein